MEMKLLLDSNVSAGKFVQGLRRTTAHVAMFIIGYNVFSATGRYLMITLIDDVKVISN